MLDRADALSPTLFDVYTEIKKDRSINAQAQHAILDRLASVLTELGPDVLAWRKGWLPSELATRAIIFEGCGLTERSVSLVIEHLLESRFMACVAEGMPNRSLNLLIAIEDAQTMLSCGSDEGEMGVLDEMMGLVRGSGIGIMLMAQSVHGVSPHVLSNTGTKIMGRVGHGGDVTSMGRAMGITHEQIRWSMNTLRPGIMVVQVADPSHRKPFVLRTPPMQALPPVTGADVERSLAPLISLPMVFAKEYHNWTPEERIEVNQPPPPPASPPSSPPTSSDSPIPNDSPTDTTPIPPADVLTQQASPNHARLADDAMTLLRAIDTHPGTPMSKLGKLAGLSNRKLYALRKQLTALGLIRQESLSIKATGRPAVILVLTLDGKRVLKDSTP